MADNRRFGLFCGVVVALGVWGLVGCTAGPQPVAGESEDSTEGSDETESDAWSEGGAADSSGGGGGSDTSSSSGSDATDPWADSDRDGHLDRFDNCPKQKNSKQKDKDGDGIGNPCDNRSDCANKNQKTKICDEKGYDHKRDRDKDGTDDVDDNCPETKNKEQKDSDGDGTGDACETPPSKKYGKGKDSDKDGLADSKEGKTGTSANSRDTDGDGILDGAEVGAGSNPTSADQACGDKKYKADLVRKPVDIIFSIDTSGSMDDEINAVERNINNSFARIIRKAGVNYRVIMLANRGQGQNKVCIKSPLGGGCGNTSKFKHVDTNRAARAGEKPFRMFLKFYSTYKKWLRPNSFKFLVLFSDEEEQTDFGMNLGDKASAEEFDKRLRGKSKQQFGTKNNRNFQVHSVVGVPKKGNQKAWKPSASIKNSPCGSAWEGAPTSEWIAKMTGGLRYPVCNTGSYDVIFKAIAKSVVKRAKIQCKLDLPKVGKKKSIDKDKIALQWNPKQGSKTVLKKVHKKSSCGADKFYLKNGKVRLCKSICQTVKNTKKGKLRVLAGCVNCKKSEEKCDYKDNDCDGDVDENCKGCTPELCDGKDNNCNGKVDEGCCKMKAVGDKCSKNSECCTGYCKSEGVCGKPCRPEGTTCASDSQCCSKKCAGKGSGKLGSCVGQ